MSDLTQQTLVTFVAERIADDYRAAHLAKWPYGEDYPQAPPWPTADQWSRDLSTDDGPLLGLMSPDRVLAECDAKRRLIDWAFANAETIDGEWGDGCLEADMRAGRCDDYGMRAVEEVLTKLALLYVDHPDWREEWRP